MFSCDLISNSKKHIQFLKDIHPYNIATFGSIDDSTTKVTVPSAVAIESLRRYEELWIPLVATVTTLNEPIVAAFTQLIPPPDIAWLWHCHRLAPQQYSKYCKTNKYTNGHIIEANPPFSFVKEQQVSSIIDQTKILWKRKYPNESFYLQLNKEQPTISNSDDVCPLVNGFDLLGSTIRQMSFLWQVSGERYKDDSFLYDGVENYEKFLRLTNIAQQQNIILVPTYQIDLMWHTHMLTSITNYNNDCIKIMNRTMYHDDSLTDRSDGGILDTSYIETQKLWKRMYGKDYVVFGGMYRGEPPSTYYSSDWSKQIPNGKANTILVNEKLIGKVGASSTSQQSKPSIPWTPLNDYTSDRRPAFIRTIQQTKGGIKDLSRMDNYVLGRQGTQTGYFHIETREAHEILYKRLDRLIKNMEHDIAIQKSCCGNLDNIKKQEVELKNLTATRAALHQQIYRSTSNTRNMDTAGLYPFTGGACGGVVATSGGGGKFFCFQLP
jgi:hypothetical protein